MELKTFYLETYGCSANQNNSEIMAGLLARAGFVHVARPENADLLIINSCIVKGPTENRLKRKIQDLARLKKPIIVAGCAPEAIADDLLRLSSRLFLLGVHHTRDIVKLARKIAEGKAKPTEFVGKRHEIKLCMPKILQNKVISITQICEGCFGNCSFCITRYAKGELFSYPIEMIVKSIRQDLEAGCKEIWITSQDNAAYGLDFGKHALPKLLEEVLGLKHNFFLRLGMMNPNTLLSILDRILTIYEHKKMFKFLHVPLQSASNKVLCDMKRGYTLDDFLKIVRAFKEKFPDGTFSTDVIVGYPTESEEDFQETLQVIKDINPEVLNVSKFWPRKLTEASKLKPLPPEIVKARARKLMEMHKKISKEKMKQYLGREVVALVDKKQNNKFFARDTNYRLLELNTGKELLGKFIKAKITGVRHHHFLASYIKTTRL